MIDNIIRIISNAVNVYNAKEYWHTQHYPWNEVRFSTKELKFIFSKNAKNFDKSFPFALASTIENFK